MRHEQVQRPTRRAERHYDDGEPIRSGYTDQGVKKAKSTARRSERASKRERTSA